VEVKRASEQNELFFQNAGLALIYGRRLADKLRVQPADGGAVVCAAMSALWEMCGQEDVLNRVRHERVGFIKMAQVVMRRRVLNWLRDNQCKTYRNGKMFSLDGLKVSGWDIEDRKGTYREKARMELDECLAELRNDLLRKVLWHIGRGFTKKAVAERMGVSQQQIAILFQKGVEQIRRKHRLVG